MRSHIITSGLTIALALSGMIAPAMGQPTDRTIAQAEKISEFDRAMAGGFRLFKEGNAESLSKAVVQIERALGLARSAKAQDKQSLALLALGRLHEALDKKQKALEYYNQARAVGDRLGETTILNNIDRLKDK